MKKRLELLKEYVGKEFSGSPSATMRWLKGNVVKAEEGSVIIDFLVRDEMTNPAGYIHGGMMATLLDEVAGLTMACMQDEPWFVTTNLNVTFAGSVRAGETVRVEGIILKQGRVIWFTKAIAYDAKGKILAEGHATQYQTESGKANQHIKN